MNGIDTRTSNGFKIGLTTLTALAILTVGMTISNRAQAGGLLPGAKHFAVASAWDEQLGKLPMTQEKLDSYTGDLAAFLSGLVSCSPPWTSKGSTDKRQWQSLCEFHGYQLTIDASGELDLEHHVTFSGSELKPGDWDTTMKLEEDHRVNRKLKLRRVGRVQVERYRRFSDQHGMSPDREVYCIFLIVKDDNPGAAVKDHAIMTKTNSSTGSSTREESHFDDPEPCVSIYVSCEDDQALAIGRAFVKLIATHGGAATFKNEIVK